MTATMSVVPNLQAKKVTIYRNGDRFQKPWKLTINPRNIRNWDMFLDECTRQKVPDNGACRNIYTPVNGTRVDNLTQLETECNYVAANGKFKKIE